MNGQDRFTFYVFLVLLIIDIAQGGELHRELIHDISGPWHHYWHGK